MKKTQILSLVVVLVLALTVVFAACTPSNTEPTDELAEERTNAKTEIDNFVKGLVESEYTAEGWTSIQNAVTACKTAIDAAKTAEEITKAVSDAKAAINAVAKAPTGPDTTSYAFGLVNGDAAVAQATITKNSEGEVINASLDEAELPTVITADEAIEGYTTAIEVTGWSGPETKNYYDTIKIAGVTFTINAEGTYETEDKTIVEWLKEGTNAMNYFKAVSANQVEVITGAETSSKEIMCAETLLKTKNGYWPEGQSGMGWQNNVDATIDYVLTNGFDAESFTADEDKIFVDNNGVSTGATWTHFNDYYTLLKTAATTNLYIGHFHYFTEAWGGNHYGAQVAVSVDADNKITAVNVLADEITGWHQITPTWDTEGVAADKQAQFISETLVGMTIEEVLELTAEITVENDATVPADVTIEFVGNEGSLMTGATQSEVRLILAIWNALGY